MAPPLDLMIAGAQKAGTSSLVRYLGQHPTVCVQTKREFTYFVNDAEYEGGYARAFSQQFPSCDSVPNSNRKYVAKSAGLMYLPESIARLRLHNPEVHVALLLRNPVKRAYSAFWFARQRGWENLESFEEALDADPNRFKGYWLHERGCAYLDRGRYAEFVEDLSEQLPSGHLHIELTEDLKERAGEICTSLYEAIGLDDGFVPDTSHRHNESGQARLPMLARSLSLNPPFTGALRKLFPDTARDYLRNLRSRLKRLNYVSFDPPPMDPETQQRLLDYYRPHNERLEKLIGRDLSSWNRS